eukprot:Blabericola_migrator_1__7444@NODE_3796_length_1503_cov_775_933844_g2354_i0_p1_GENE_NODE_3796_length_1503_cov_775_933844_g2354_i0NODE_3796_length_1503_cov_775_933844_g2354_i0_p1_ORF_typecomplete_len396_score54_69DUF4166/PF13761_6/1_9e02DUF4166/PF13761_6/1_3_NODE_3796_length_1503_cov_775_933844_g2354_i01501337
MSQRVTQFLLLLSTSLCSTIGAEQSPLAAPSVVPSNYVAASSKYEPTTMKLKAPRRQLGELGRLYIENTSDLKRSKDSAEDDPVLREDRRRDDAAQRPPAHPEVPLSTDNEEAIRGMVAYVPSPGYEPEVIKNLRQNGGGRFGWNRGSSIPGPMVTHQDQSQYRPQGVNRSQGGSIYRGDQERSQRMYSDLQDGRRDTQDIGPYMSQQRDYNRVSANPTHAQPTIRNQQKTQDQRYDQPQQSNQISRDFRSGQLSRDMRSDQVSRDSVSGQYNRDMRNDQVSRDLRNAQFPRDMRSDMSSEQYGLSDRLREADLDERLDAAFGIPAAPFRSAYERRPGSRFPGSQHLQNPSASSSHSAYNSGWSGYDGGSEASSPRRFAGPFDRSPNGWSSHGYY